MKRLSVDPPACFCLGFLLGCFCVFLRIVAGYFLTLLCESLNLPYGEIACVKTIGCVAYIRLRVFAWGLCLGVSAYFCVLLQATF